MAKRPISKKKDESLGKKRKGGKRGLKSSKSGSHAKREVDGGSVSSASIKVTPKEIDVPAQEELITGQIQPETRLKSGPRKERKKHGAPRISNHKARSVWFRARATWPVREAPTPTLVRERVLVKKTLPPAPGNAQWVNVGPTNIGGRMTSVVCHPQQPERIWAGAAGGGVWFSPDAGQTWQAQWHDEDVLNVGSLAIDSKNPDTIYCGTGEANLSADSYAGVGIYRTLDGGVSWHLFASVEQAGVPRRIGVIAIDPFNSKHLKIGGIGFAEMGHAHDIGGMYTTVDGGLTWKRETFVSPFNYWCHSIVFDPNNENTLYATFTARGSSSGIYRSLDGGDNWTQLTNGLPVPERLGRTSLAISPSHPKVLYAFATDVASGNADSLLGVFRTNDGGDTWVNTAGNHFVDEGQISYGNTIAVHPTNPNHVICGGVDLHLLTNGGRNWRRVTQWDAERDASNYAHADHHCLVMPAIAPGRVYDANDGGLDVSGDGGANWVNRSNGLAITMYYDLDAAQSDGRVYGGGAQDNGTLITTTGGSNNHFELLGGDGGWITFDPKSAGHIYASFQHFGIFRFRPGSRPKRATPPAGTNEQNFVWMCYIAMDPNNSNTVFTGSYRVWRTHDDGDSWVAVSPMLDESTITAIEIAPADSKRIYVGTENGGFFRSTDGGNTWSSNLASATLPGHSITRLATSPADANLLFATVANFGHKHVFRSNNGGRTWEDVDRGQLPDVPHHSIAIPRNTPKTIYVCNDVGVFVSLDGGTAWMNVTRNLPNVMVVDLVHHAKDGTLSAATYGRSIWRLKV